MIQLRILGPTELLGHEGQSLLSVLSRHKRLTLFSYLNLAATGTFVRREKLVDLFWPGSEPERGRASLRTALSGLRTSLGPGTLVSRGDDEVGIAPGAVSCDAVRFEAALARGDLLPAWELYRGTLLDGISLPEAPALDRWLDDERARLERGALTVAIGLSERSTNAGELAEAVRWARAALLLEPLSELGNRRLIRLLGQTGDREGAIRAFEGFAARLKDELDLEPSAETAALAHSVRTAGPAPTAVTEPPPTAVAEPSDAGRAEKQDVVSWAPAPDPPLPSHDEAPPTSRRRNYLGTATIALATFVIGFMLWGSRSGAPLDPVVRYNLVTADGEDVHDFPGRRFAISPDGSRFVYVSGPNRSLRLRQRDQLHAPMLPDIDGARSPFFSPDGESVGFISDGRLKLASLRGGGVKVVTDGVDSWGGAAWGDDGFIYMSQTGFGGVFRVASEVGAVPEPVTVLDPDRNESDHKWPEVLPNGRGIVFTAGHAGLGLSTSSIAVTDLVTETHKYLVEGIYARYVASGHLLYVTPDRTLMLAPFDDETLEMTGPPTVVSSGIRVGFRGAIDLGVSTTGTLVYSTAPEPPTREVVRVTRDGAAEPLDPPWEGDLAFPSVSPDGTRLALVVNGPRTSDVWIRDLDSGATMKLTVDQDVTGYPAWTADAESVTYFWNSGAGTTLWTKSAAGGRPAVRQLENTRDLAESLWSPDGEWLVYRTSNVPVAAGTRSDEPSPGAADIFALRPAVDSAPIPIANTKFAELAPALSPDGNWLAYASEETGQEEIFVVPFPDARAGKWSVTPEGGTEPVWSRTGEELFYRDLRGVLMAVDVRTNPGFSLGPSKVLFEVRRYVGSGLHRSYDVTPDGKGFFMVRTRGAPDPGEVVVVENWFTELANAR